MMALFGVIKFYYKSAVSLLILGCSATFGVTSSLLLSLIGKRYWAQWATARVFYYLYSTFLGINIKVINKKSLNNLPCIFISNHQSAMDIMVIGKCFPKNCTVTAKNSLKYAPVLGWFMTLSGTLFLDRRNGAKSIAAMKNSLHSLVMKKRALWIFPEGTRCSSNKLEMLPFKKGAFHLAQQGKIPVVPVVVSNTSNIFNKKLGVFNRGTIVVKVLEPISTEDLKPEDIGEFTKKVQGIMLEELKTLGYSETTETIVPALGESQSKKPVQEQSELVTEEQASLGEEEPVLVSQ